MKRNKNIILNGISTHNLKGIDIEIPLNKITTIYGRSGAGKTSLAFSSLYQLCKDEFDALEQGYFDDKDYQIESYSNLIPAVAITQKNTNNNPRSTLYSFLNISHILQSIIIANSAKDAFPLLKINKPENTCSVCNGSGESIVFSTQDSIEKERSILENPFPIWKSSKSNDYYYQLLLAFCTFKGIDINTPFHQLPDEQQNELLYYSGKEKIIFKAKYAGKSKQRKDFYQGIYEYAQNNPNLKSISSFLIKNICTHCLGSRINKEKYKSLTIGDLLFADFLNTSFDVLLERLPKTSEFDFLRNILKQLCNLNLGYLNFARSIPSLSGGELQKIKFSKLLNSNISGVLIVIDELSSQLGESDYPKILQTLRELSQKNTIVLIEHSSYFIDNADNNIHIGLFAGEKGGVICESEKIKPIEYKRNIQNIQHFIEIKNINKNNVINQNISIPKKALTVFTGISGSGKSSVAKFIEENFNAIYISQKVSNYSKRSTLANTLKCQEYIAQFFAKHTELPESLFIPNKDGGCEECCGLGVIEYERSFEKNIVTTCPTCNGLLFNLKNKEYLRKIHNFNIIDIYNSEISDVYQFFSEFSSVNHLFMNTLETMIALGLGHLKLNRKTQTLSGGELRRVRLCEHLSKLRSSEKILIIDEPIAGLDPETGSKVAHFIQSKLNLYSAIIVIEHRKEIMPFCDFEVSIGPYSGKNGGKIMSCHAIST